MNILELDSYNLADAVKFNDRLNPRLWDKNEHMLPKVRDHLLQIADDFREFLGVSGYELKDITVSGSNAAYTYTPNSDIDLHLVVDLPQADASEVYRELFDAKKFQFNEQHNISIGGYPVELYVQDANKKHVSQGIYSVLNNEWLDVPKRRDTGVDDISTRSKYEDLAHRIDAAIKSDDYASMSDLMNKIKAMRQTGLDQHGEFGAENLAFKMLRNQGAIERLVKARNAAKDRELSLKERTVEVNKPFKYGFTTTEDVSANPSGVSPETKMFLSEKPTLTVPEVVSSFIDYCIEKLNIEQNPVVKFKRDPAWSARNKTFGRYNVDHNLLEVSLANRHVMDILRTVAHELTHTRQHEIADVPDDAGATGSRWENEANAKAGVLMREYAQMHPEYFEPESIDEGLRSQPPTRSPHRLPTSDQELAKRLHPLSRDPNLALAQKFAMTHYPTVGSNPDEAYNKLVQRGMMHSQENDVIHAKKIGNLEKQVAALRRELTDVETKDGIEEGSLADMRDYFSAVDPARPVVPNPISNKMPPEIIDILTRINNNEPVSKEDYYKLVAYRKPKQDAEALKKRSISEGMSWSSLDEGLSVDDKMTIFEEYCIKGSLTESVDTGKKDYFVSLIKLSDTPVKNKTYIVVPLSLVANRIMILDKPDYMEFLGQHGGSLVFNTASGEKTYPAKTMRDLSVFNTFTFLSVTEYDKFRTALALKFDTHLPNINDQQGVTESSGYIPTKKQAKDPRFVMALTKDVRPGATGKEANKLGLKTDSQGHPALLMNNLASALREFKETGKLPPKTGYGAAPLTQEPGGIEDEYGNQEATGPEFPPQMPKNTSKIKVSDFTDLYRLGQDISDMDDADAEDYNQGPPQTVIVFPNDAAEKAYNKQFNRLGLKTKNITGNAKIDESDLFEINMSPTSLRAQAAQIGAIAGMEFEMIVPNTGGGDENDEQEPDYDQDQSARSIDDITHFFHDGDYNGRIEINRLQSRLQDDYNDWTSDRMGEEWQENGQDFLEDYIKNNEFDMDAAREAATDDVRETNPDLSENSEEFAKLVTRHTREKLAEVTEESWDSQDKNYDYALEEFEDEQRDNYSESDWLEDANLDTMSAVENRYEIMWPHWTSGSSGGGRSIEEIADDFGSAIDRPVNHSTKYHGGKRTTDGYVVEPDGSLDADDPDDAGLEFISPPLPIDDMLSDLNKVKAWAKKTGCYTNDSTGLHINVSIPEYNAENLDYVKLALLMGDQYVLDLFGRTGNTYAESALAIVKKRVAERPEDAAALLAKMRGNLESIATRAVHSGITKKFTSINNKSGYIEFRSPGGDWLGENFDKIENTLLRFVVALDSALNPEKDREEYLTKLYKLLAPAGSKNTIAYFSQYVAGKIPQAALKSFVRQAQLERKSVKDTYKELQPAATKQYVVTDRSGYSMLITAASPYAAQVQAETQYPDKFREVVSSVLSVPPAQAQAQQQAAQASYPSGAALGGEWTGQWLIKDSETDAVLHRFGNIGSSQADANRRAMEWARQTNHGSGIEVVPEMF